MGDEGQVVSAEVGGWNVDTNSAQSAEDLQESLKNTSAGQKEAEKSKDEEKEVSEAASKVGKKGGEAAAKAKKEAKAAKPQEKDEPEDKEASGKEKQPEETPEPEKDEDKKEEKPLGKPRHDPRARMLQATRQTAELKRELAAVREAKNAVEARLQALEQGRTAPAPSGAPEGRSHAPEGDSQSPSEPKEDDFDDYGTFIRALINHHKGEWTKDLVKRYQDDTQHQQQAAEVDHALSQRISQFSDAARDVMEQISDEVRELKAEFQLGEGEQATADNWIANELVLSAENPGALMLHFSSEAGIDDFQRIAALSTPHAVSREMAKLETRLELAAPPGNSPEPEPEVSKASPPLKPVRGAGHVADSDGFRQGMSLDEYSKHWNSKVRPKLR